MKHSVPLLPISHMAPSPVKERTIIFIVVGPILTKHPFRFRLQPLYFLEITASGLYLFDIGPY
jgi:hypothetical protein